MSQKQAKESMTPGQIHSWISEFNIKCFAPVLCSLNPSLQACSLIRRSFGFTGHFSVPSFVYSYLLTNWLAYLYGRIQSPRPDVMPDRREGITRAASFGFACIDTQAS